nr:hypothetical protein [uncultured Brevundimonas sp.]
MAEAQDLHLWGVSNDDVNGAVAEGRGLIRFVAALAEMNDVHDIDHATVQAETGADGGGLEPAAGLSLIDIPPAR